MTFVVFSLPRSRSAWLSVFLGKGISVGHDIGPDSATPQDFLDRLADGTCETGAAFAWRLIRKARPDAKFAVVRRSPRAVADSLARFGLNDQLVEMQRRADQLEEIAGLHGTLTVEYDDLGDYLTCARLFAFCRGYIPDRTWWAHLDALNIQVDMPRQLAKLARNHQQIEVLKRTVVEEMACG